MDKQYMVLRNVCCNQGIFKCRVQCKHIWSHNLLIYTVWERLQQHFSSLPALPLGEPVGTNICFAPALKDKYTMGYIVNICSLLNCPQPYVIDSYCLASLDITRVDFCFVLSSLSITVKVQSGLKRYALCWMQWCAPVISATLETEDGGLVEPRSSGTIQATQCHFVWEQKQISKEGL